MNWLRQLYTRSRRYNELSESIREHLDEKIAELVDRGMPREQAVEPPDASSAMSHGSKAQPRSLDVAAHRKHLGRHQIRLPPTP